MRTERSDKRLSPTAALRLMAPFLGILRMEAPYLRSFLGINLEWFYKWQKVFAPCKSLGNLYFNLTRMLCTFTLSCPIQVHIEVVYSQDVVIKSTSYNTKYVLLLRDLDKFSSC